VLSLLSSCAVFFRLLLMIAHFIMISRDWSEAYNYLTIKIFCFVWIFAGRKFPRINFYNKTNSITTTLRIAQEIDNQISSALPQESDSRIYRWKINGPFIYYRWSQRIVPLTWRIPFQKSPLSNLSIFTFITITISQKKSISMDNAKAFNRNAHLLIWFDSLNLFRCVL
jgi:hypothetical protein